VVTAHDKTVRTTRGWSSWLPELEVLEPHPVLLERIRGCIIVLLPARWRVWGCGATVHFDWKHVRTDARKAFLHGVVERFDMVRRYVPEAFLNDIVGEFDIFSPCHWSLAA